MTDTAKEPGKKPDFVFNHINEKDSRPDIWTDVGGAWSNDKGYISVDSPVFGKFVLQPREELERMREERKQSNGQAQEMKHEHGPS